MLLLFALNTLRQDYIQLHGRKRQCLVRQPFQRGENLRKMESLKGNLIRLSKCSLICEKVDVRARRLKGSGQWSHQSFMCEWGETME